MTATTHPNGTLEAARAEQTGTAGTRPVIASVCKQLDFPAAHTNGHHDGACSQKHGHTWTLEIYARGEIVADEVRSDFGMVVDFGAIKEVYRDSVEPFVEHQDLDLTLAHLPERTVELIAAWILSQLHSSLPCVHKVRLWEGKTSFAEVEL